jgi:hypothetical protein
MTKYQIKASVEEFALEDAVEEADKEGKGDDAIQTEVQKLEDILVKYTDKYDELTVEIDDEAGTVTLVKSPEIPVLAPVLSDAPKLVPVLKKI